MGDNQPANRRRAEPARGGSDPGNGIHVNGWCYQVNSVGTYGTSYKLREMGAIIGLGVNLPEDAVSPASFVDAAGNPYAGTSSYVLHFAKDQLPPADAFWSVTLYDEDGFQVVNSLDRFAFGDRDPRTFNPDGSLDIVIQQASPGTDNEANWLPAPAGAFNLALRRYSLRGRSLTASGRRHP